jgi:hypothetical protein
MDSPFRNGVTAVLVDPEAMINCKQSYKNVAHANTRIERLYNVKNRRERNARQQLAEWQR